MNAFFRQYLFAPGLIVFGLMTLFMFQNCSSGVGFDASPSGDFADPINRQDVDTVVGGNSSVIIDLNEFPKDSTNDISQVVDFEVRTPDSSIKSIVCELNGVVVACSPVDRITIPPTGLGAQNFTITAVNANDISGSKSIDWTVFRGLVEKTKNFNVTVVGDKVDIIVNIDNSGSMEFEQESLSSKIANFMAPFAGLDYHLAITTTSPIGGHVSTSPTTSVYVWKPELDYVDGKYVELDGAGTHCIKSSVHSITTAQQLLSANVVRGKNLLDDLGQILYVNGRTYPEGNGWERGIFTTYRAIERESASEQAGGACLRDGTVPKHVILISDENETTFEEDDNNTVTGPALIFADKSKGSELVKLVSNTFGSNTIFRFHSIIVNPFGADVDTCLGTHGRAVGTDYAELSLDTGGFIGSVCAADYTSQLSSIGKLISDSRSSETLDCIAVADANGSFGKVENLGTGQVLGIPYTFNGDKVDFSQMLGVGNYRITYNCHD